MRSVPWLTWTNIPLTLLAVVDEVNRLDHRASTAKIAHTTGADTEACEERKQSKNGRRGTVWHFIRIAQLIMPVAVCENT